MRRRGALCLHRWQVCMGERQGLECMIGIATDRHLQPTARLQKTPTCPDLSCAGIVASLVLTMWSFVKVEPLAALLLVPYLLWGIFAIVLTSAYMNLNPQASAPLRPRCCSGNAPQHRPS